MGPVQIAVGQQNEFIISIYLHLDQSIRYAHFIPDSQVIKFIKRSRFSLLTVVIHKKNRVHYCIK